MLLCLQKYNLKVKYKKEREMLLADTLSDAYLPEVNATEFSREPEDVDHCTWLPVTVDHRQQLKNATADDPVQQKLREVADSWKTEHKHPLFNLVNDLELSAVIGVFIAYPRCVTGMAL